MNIDKLMEMVDEDIGKPLRRDMIEWEASRNQALHQKYRKILYHEKVDLDRMKASIEPLRRAKREYYLAVDAKPTFALKLDTKVKVQTEETEGKKRVIKDEVMYYVDTDPDIVRAKELLSLQAEKIEFLKDTLDDIRRRSFSQSIIINTQRFKHCLENLGQVIEITDPEYESS